MYEKKKTKLPNSDKNRTNLRTLPFGKCTVQIRIFAGKNLEPKKKKQDKQIKVKLIIMQNKKVHGNLKPANIQIQPHFLPFLQLIIHVLLPFSNPLAFYI